MTNQITQLGVVGCGWAGCRAIEAANATARLNVIAIAERDPTRREQGGRRQCSATPLRRLSRTP